MPKTDNKDKVFYFTTPSWESFGQGHPLDWRSLKIEQGPIDSVHSDRIVYLPDTKKSYPAIFTAPTKDQLIDTMIAWLNRMRRS